ncbi:MAG: carboxymuconolactone decarboxylase family protein [Myxococcales bacterium]|nr:carboxymuconolactone decarboxylase family protein [Myxococcales bacterium]
MTIDRGFSDLDESSAPEAARPILEATRAEFGIVPSVVARMVTAPALFEAFRAAAQAFERTSLSPVERELVILVIARDVGCEVCITMHSRLLRRIDQSALAEKLVEGVALGDTRLDALAAFTRELLVTRGDVGVEIWDAFLGAGYTRAQALEIMIGCGAYTMSTYANRLTGGTLAAARPH